MSSLPRIHCDKYAAWWIEFDVFPFEEKSAEKGKVIEIGIQRQIEENSRDFVQLFHSRWSRRLYMNKIALSSYIENTMEPIT